MRHLSVTFSVQAARWMMVIRGMSISGHKSRCSGVLGLQRPHHPLQNLWELGTLGLRESVVYSTLAGIQDSPYIVSRKSVPPTVQRVLSSPTGSALCPHWPKWLRISSIGISITTVASTACRTHERATRMNSSTSSEVSGRGAKVTWVWWTRSSRSTRKVRQSSLSRSQHSRYQCLSAGARACGSTHRCVTAPEAAV